MVSNILSSENSSQGRFKGLNFVLFVNLSYLSCINSNMTILGTWNRLCNCLGGLNIGLVAGFILGLNIGVVARRGSCTRP